jgi:hypothetical protein
MKHGLVPFAETSEHSDAVQLFFVKSKNNLMSLPATNVNPANLLESFEGFRKPLYRSASWRYVQEP